MNDSCNWATLNHVQDSNDATMRIRATNIIVFLLYENPDQVYVCDSRVWSRFNHVHAGIKTTMRIGTK